MQKISIMTLCRFAVQSVPFHPPCEFTNKQSANMTFRIIRNVVGKNDRSFNSGKSRQFHSFLLETFRITSHHRWDFDDISLFVLDLIHLVLN